MVSLFLLFKCASNATTTTHLINKFVDAHAQNISDRNFVYAYDATDRIVNLFISIFVCIIAYIRAERFKYINGRADDAIYQGCEENYHFTISLAATMSPTSVASKSNSFKSFISLRIYDSQHLRPLLIHPNFGAAIPIELLLILSV